MATPVGVDAGDCAGVLAVAIGRYVAQLRRSYPVDPAGAPDPFAVGIHQVADVIQGRLDTLEPPALREWLARYARALFRTHPDRTDPVGAAALIVAGDLQVALLAWGDQAPDGEFRAVVADAFAVRTHQRELSRRR